MTWIHLQRRARRPRLPFSHYCCYSWEALIRLHWDVLPALLSGLLMTSYKYAHVSHSWHQCPLSDLSVFRTSRLANLNTSGVQKGPGPPRRCSWLHPIGSNLQRQNGGNMEILIDLSCTGGGRGGGSCSLWTRGDEIEKRFIIEAAALSLRGSAWALRRRPPHPPHSTDAGDEAGRAEDGQIFFFFLLTLSRHDVSGAAQREGLWGKSGRMKATAQLSTRRPSAERPVLPPHIVRTRRKVLSAQRRPRTPPRRPRAARA